MTHGQKNQKIITQHREIEDCKGTVTRQATEIDTLVYQCEIRKKRIKGLKHQLDFQTEYACALNYRLKDELKKAEEIARVREEIEKDRLIRDMEMMSTIGDLTGHLARSVSLKRSIWVGLLS